MKTVHQQLIDSVFEFPVTPRDHAIINEINSLRKRIAELEKKKPKKKNSK